MIQIQNLYTYSSYMIYEKDEVMKSDSEKLHAHHTAKVIYHQNFSAFKQQ